jgi:hypothetical protein
MPFRLRQVHIRHRRVSASHLAKIGLKNRPPATAPDRGFGHALRHEQPLAAFAGDLEFHGGVSEEHTGTQLITSKWLKGMPQGV